MSVQRQCGVSIGNKEWVFITVLPVSPGQGDEVPPPHDLINHDQ